MFNQKISKHKLKKIGVLLLISSLLLLIGTNLTIFGNADTDILIEGEADDFSYRYKVFNNTDISMMQLGNISELIIDFGDGTIGDQVNELRMWISTELNTYDTGGISLDISFNDTDGNSWQYTFSKDVMTIFVNSTIPQAGGGDLNWIDFYGAADVNYIKSQNINVSDPDNIAPSAGIDNLEIRPPEIKIVNDENELVWGLEYRSITPWINMNGSLNWNINSSFIRNYTYHFYVKNQAAYLFIRK